jgi:hypothetical protein
VDRQNAQTSAQNKTRKTLQFLVGNANVGRAEHTPHKSLKPKELTAMTKKAKTPTKPPAKIAEKPSAKPATKPATKPAAAAAKPATKPAEKPAAALAIHVNKTGRVCFGREAAVRLGKPEYCAVSVDKGVIRIEPTKKADGALPVRDASGRPYISATRQFKPLGFDGSRAYDCDAKPYGSSGFEFRLA